MKKLKLFSLFLALICLCACTGAEAPDAGYLLQDGQKTTPAYILALDGKEVSFAEYRHFYLNTKTDFDAGEESFWTEHPEQKEALKETVLSYLKESYAALFLADEYGIVLNDADLANISKTIRTAKEELGDAGFRDQLAAFYLDMATYEKMQNNNALYDKLYDSLTAPGGALSVDANQYMDYLSENYVCYAQIYVDFEQGEGTISYERTQTVADEAYTRLQSGDDFYAVAFALSDDADMTAHKNGYLRKKEGFDEALLAALSALEENAYSAPVLTATGFYILKRLPISDAIAEEYESEVLDGYEDATGAHINGLYENRFADLCSARAEKITVTYSPAYEHIFPDTVF